MEQTPLQAGSRQGKAVFSPCDALRFPDGSKRYKQNRKARLSPLGKCVPDHDPTKNLFCPCDLQGSAQALPFTPVNGSGQSFL